jgi:hypothetical protein
MFTHAAQVHTLSKVKLQEAYIMEVIVKKWGNSAAYITAAKRNK